MSSENRSSSSIDAGFHDVGSCSLPTVKGLLAEMCSGVLCELSPAEDERVRANFIKLFGDIEEAWRRLTYTEVDVRVAVAVARLCKNLNP